MATCTLAVGTADTGTTPNTSGSFTPASGDLLVVLAQAATTVDASPTCASSVGGFTFTLVRHQLYGGSADSVYAFVSDALVSSASSQTVTVDCPSDAANGTVIHVYRVSGMTKTGATAVRQMAGTFNGASTTPFATFSSSCLTGNPVLCALGNVSNPAGITPPTDWTESANGDLGYSTPTRGQAVCHRNSGFTGTTVTWAANSPSAWGTVALELDTSANAKKGGFGLMGMGR